MGLDHEKRGWVGEMKIGRMGGRERARLNFLVFR
jgi:hypothetical protein